ncbi:conserved hypothetical protein [Flavobacterium sp. 9AF]|uniref:hypothetical protein n=1 Tax=Flavobacterium sp. 9AF TaxID=2653142 RepID=UPI0012F1B77F|nr:hypothetical protein [Flavobacterium sp. 9AF]VXB79680.1 conserved hypothetical protein [Flavobacterium sp. 9AF]
MEKLELYTYILEFRGGTYSTQVYAENLSISIEKWLEKLIEEKNEIKYLGNTTIINLKSQIKNKQESPTSLKGLKNIWYFRLNFKQGVFSVNIIKTSTV